MVGYPATGDQLGAYRIDAEVGRGGMGIVFRATQLSLDRPVALKVLDPRLATDAAFVDRFSREATILASLDSPHIVQIYDHSARDGHLYLAMQYVSGGDLAELLKREGPLPPLTALRIFAQILDALADAHARGVVHRDVKPSNVLLRSGDGEPFAYLCDFGIAQTADAGVTQPGMVAGSWAFMSPERHAGQPATPRSDLYSSACVLWTMLTGRNPYSGSDVQVAYSHLNGPVPQLPGTDPLVVSLNRLFWACLAKNPDERPASAAETLVLTRSPLALAADVPPLSVSKPDSGIFRPQAPAWAPPPVPAAAPAVAPSRRGRGRRTWLVAAGALAVAAGLLFGVLNLSGAFGRQSAGPSASASATGAQPPSQPAASFVCWDGTVVSDLVACETLQGREALEYLYPSLDTAECTYKRIVASGLYDCKLSAGLIRYRFWLDPERAVDHYTEKYAQGEQQPLLLDGHDIGVVYRRDVKASGRYTLSGLWLEGRFSFSLEARTIPEREALFDQLKFRAYDQLVGHPQGQAPGTGRLG